jgi:hypothetical protein
VQTCELGSQYTLDAGLKVVTQKTGMRVMKKTVILLLAARHCASLRVYGTERFKFSGLTAVRKIQILMDSLNRSPKYFT